MNDATRPTDPKFIAEIAALLGRPLDDREVALATSLQDDKTAALVARELAGAPIADPKKIRPEHKDTADE